MNKKLMQFIDTCEVCNAFQTKNQVTGPGQKLGLIFLIGLRNTIWFLLTIMHMSPGKAGECVGESFSTFMKSSDFSQQIAETATKRAQHSNQL